MKKKIISYITAFLFILPFIYFKMPVINMKFSSIFDILFKFFIVATLVDIIQAVTQCIKSEASNKTDVSESEFNDICFSFIKRNFNFKIVVLALIAETTIPFITSSPIFHADKYKELIGEVEVSTFTEDIHPVDDNNIRVVDRDMAYKLADKKLGEIPAIGSIAQLGTLNIQNVNGDLYWVGPLEHRNFIKWFSNKEGTPGYIMVSATNPQDVKLVQELNGAKLNLKYLNSAYFNDNIKRHIYFSGYSNVGLRDFTFEIDDDGNPYWVVSMYKNTIGFNGPEVTGVITVNASTGELNTYSIDNAPKWIDRIQPENLVIEQINYWGAYVNGFWNSISTQKDVLKTSSGTSLVFGDDGESYWYTGLTSVGSDESTVGFILVNTRNKKAKIYHQSGATESAAMRSAQGKVQEKGYVATFPAMYNILGTPTYAISLKDNAGLVKMFSFVSVSDYTIVGIGESKEEALRDYKEKLKRNGNNIEINSNIEKKDIEGNVLRISQDIIDGNAYYNFLLDNSDGLVFSSLSSISKELSLTLPGDRVKISYEENSSKSIDIVEFDNLNIP